MVHSTCPRPTAVTEAYPYACHMMLMIQHMSSPLSFPRSHFHSPNPRLLKRQTRIAVWVSSHLLTYRYTVASQTTNDRIRAHQHHRNTMLPSPRRHHRGANRSDAEECYKWMQSRYQPHLEGPLSPPLAAFSCSDNDMPPATFQCGLRVAPIPTWFQGSGFGLRVEGLRVEG